MAEIVEKGSTLWQDFGRQQVRRSRLKTLGAIAGVVTVSLYVQWLLGDRATPMECAQLVPPDALATVYMDTNPTAWRAIDRYGTPELRSLAQESLERLQAKQLAPNSIDLQQDVQSWVGGAMLAILPPSDSSPAPDVLLVLGIRNKWRLMRLLGEMQRQNRSQITFNHYRQVQIVEIAEEEGSTYVLAMLHHHLLVGLDRYTVRQAIDAYRGDPSLANRPEAIQLLARMRQGGNPPIQVYVNLARLRSSYSSFFCIESSNGSLICSCRKDEGGDRRCQSGQNWDKGAHLFALSRQDDVTKTSTKTLRAETLRAETLHATSLQGKFPQQTVALWQGHHLDRLWKTVKTTAKTADSQPFLAQVNQLFAPTYLTPDEVFGWMDGEFALGAVSLSDGNGGEGSNRLGGALLVQASDRAAANTFLKKLHTFLGDRFSMLERREATVQNVYVIQWHLPSVGVVLGHTWLTENTLALYVGDTYEAIFAPDRPRFEANESFQAIASAVQPIWFYVDVEQLTPKFQLLFSSQDGEKGDRPSWLDVVASVGITSARPSPSFLQVDVLMPLSESPGNASLKQGK
ncbi:MAG: DUF3352 domain-containing protein [Coleofasciculaceae cyanobacterium SM2_3_26]|nr:DUF3352 domain-containing protein [Coleofasciculaceae cyanobacterium SM2_3_26]